jgi:hypothetical protein
VMNSRLAQSCSRDGRPRFPWTGCA